MLPLSSGCRTDNITMVRRRARDRQAPQPPFALADPRINSSSSDMGTSTVRASPSSSLEIAARWRACIFYSFSLELTSNIKDIEWYHNLGDVLFPVAVESHNLWYGSRTYLVAYHSGVLDHDEECRPRRQRPLPPSILCRCIWFPPSSTTRIDQGEPTQVVV
jgi:hypothetical protein